MRSNVPLTVRAVAVLLVGLVTIGVDLNSHAQSSGARKTDTRNERRALSDSDQKLAIEFGERVEQTVAQGDGSVLEHAIDYTTIARASLSGLSLSDAEIDTYASGLIDGMKRGGGLASQILPNSYRFLRLKEVKGRPTLVFALVSPDGGMNYHFLDFEVRDGDVRIVGFYPVATGEPLSVSLRRLLVPAIAEEKKGFLSKLFGEDKGPAILANYAVFNKMNLAAQSGDYAGVIRAYDSLQGEFREDKLALVVVQTAYSMTGDDEKLTAVSEKYRKKFPDDPSLSLMMFDSLFVEKRWKEALAALDEIEDTVGGDPYLDVSRAGIYLEQKDYKTALDYALRGAEGAYTVELTHWMVATIAASMKDYERVANSCRTLREFGYYFAPEVLADPLYAEFIKSSSARALFEEDVKRMAADGYTLEDILGE